MTVFERFGVAPVVNAAGYATRLGGALMSVDVTDAMADAARASVDITSLQAAASTVIARLTGADAGLVTSGATAGLQLAAAACIAGLEVDVMDRLPDSSGVPNEIVMLRVHRTGYDHGLRAAGGHIKDVGYNTRGMGAGGRTFERWEVERAIGPATAALAATATPGNFAEIEVLADVAAAARIPLIVDAAAQLPPVDNLSRFIDAGVSLVVFSGGKAIRGPQNTGVLAGDRDLIMSAALQMLDMDETFESWKPPQEFIDRDRIAGLPQHGLGRGLKVSKEAIIGLLTALETFSAGGLEELVRTNTMIIDDIEHGLRDVDGIDVRRDDHTRWGWPRLELRVIPGSGLGSSSHLSAELKRCSPAIFLNEQQLIDDLLTIDPANLSDSHVAHVVSSVHQICRMAGPDSAPGPIERRRTGDED